MVVADSDLAFEHRPSQWDTFDLPVPTDLLVYTREEWDRMDPGCRFTKVLRNQTVWVYLRPEVGYE
jgi:hypothetical protein